MSTMTSKDAGTNFTAQLAEFVAGTSYEDLPEAVRQTARRMIMDTAGVAVAGAMDPAFSPVRTHISTWAGRGEVPAPVSRTLDVHWAAVADAVAGHLLDYDDFHATIGGHPSAPMLPVLL